MNYWNAITFMITILLIGGMVSAIKYITTPKKELLFNNTINESGDGEMKTIQIGYDNIDDIVYYMLQMQNFFLPQKINGTLTNITGDSE